ncbi:putative Esterase PHB depolymerase/Phospholipase/Carboxylesterase/Prolyl oligopeptidase family [Leishmania naiffi]|uniref:Esterase PHB depolymerase/Phospholipase/Carboxylesterase/Prolyl oligopeptidase family n=1 Tax=Leishmania naiffi TaxID=5678 RepID=A0AAW3B604_9TRYP
MSTEEVVFEGAVVASSESAPFKKDLLEALPQRTCRASAKHRIYLMVVGVLILVVPLYLWKSFGTIRIAENTPQSGMIPSPSGFDVHELIRELNIGGKKVYISDLITGAADGCAHEVSALPKGRQTVVTFKTKENTEREAVLYVPDSYPTAVDGREPQQVALMLLFHGLNDNCKHFLEATGFMSYADRDGFLIASVCGSAGILGTGWNAGMCCGFLGNKPDDVALAKQVVTELSRSMCIDQNRVMAVGFSNGAMLSEVLACSEPDTFRAVVSVAGVVEMRPGNDAGIAACTATVKKASLTSRTSVLMVHGTADPLVPWAGNNILGFPPVAWNLEGWRVRNGCTEEMNTTISTDTYTNMIYGQCTVPENVRSRKTPNGVGVELSTCFKDEASPDRDPGKSGTENARLAEKNVAPPGRQRIDSHMNLEDISATQECRGRMLQPMDKYSSGDQGFQKRGCQKAGYANAQVNIGGRRENHNLGTTRYKTVSIDFSPPPNLHWRPKEKLSMDAMRRYTGGYRCSSHNLSIDSLPKQNWEVPVQRDIVPSGRDGTSQVELVRVEGGSHTWPRDKEFSTTDYIYEFGIRIFGGYN